ncbi:MAG: Fe/S biosis protein NfuA [Actinomycetota bacterium]|nr:Fe/S biosis protein NfuA [Actinomycetota bacterium]
MDQSLRSEGGSGPVVTVTDKAKRNVLKIREGEDGGDALALWIEVNGAAAGEFTYDLYFDLATKAGEGDAVQHDDDLTVVIPAGSVDNMRGATLDMTRDLLNPGMAVTNPNRPPAAAGPGTPAISPIRAEDLSGTVPERVAQVLDQFINPSIAAHGGHVELIAVEDDAAYVRLGGGCVGCGMAAVTLSQGIEVAILEAVPEIKRIVDTTDHASGANPYYEAAKK